MTRSLFAFALAAAAVPFVAGCGHKPRAKSGEYNEGKPQPQLSDNYEERVQKVKELAPQLEKGTAVVARYVNVSKGLRISFNYLDEFAPEWKDKFGARLIQAKSMMDNQLVSTITFLVKNLEPGHYVCDGMSTAIGASMDNHWDPVAPNTYWTFNDAPNGDHGQCEIDLHEAERPGDLEGTFRAKLLMNNKSGDFLLIEMGYMYVKRF